MFCISPNFRQALFTICIIVFFCFLYPTWNASAKMDVFKQRPSTMMFEPVSKTISITRRILHGRQEFLRVKELMEQGQFAESAFTAQAAEIL